MHSVYYVAADSSRVSLDEIVILLAPVPDKTISANRGLNPANRGIKFVLRLDCVP